MSYTWLDYLHGNSRPTVTFDVPAAGRHGPAPERWDPLPIGKAVVRRAGHDLTLASLGVGVHRCLEAAEQLSLEGIEAEVIDLRWSAPIDIETQKASVERTGRLIAVDEDYEACGLSGELSGLLLECGIRFTFVRVCTRDTLPYARQLEAQALPNRTRILDTAGRLLNR